MPRFEVHDEGFQSFWEITLAGKTYTLRWGRVGSRGQSRARHFASNDEARRDYDKQIAAKTRKGYRLVAGTEEPGSFTRSDVTAPPAVRNADLEAAVIADPNDEAALLVLGDWLEAQGDPRGPLIALQAAQAREKDPAKFFALKTQATAYYGRHEAALLGPLDPWRHLFTLDWHLGYIRGAKLSFAARRDGDPGPAELVTALVALPSSVALQELAIGSTGKSIDPGAGRYADLLAHLCTTGEPRALRSLHLGAYWPGTATANDDGFLGDLDELAARFPALRRLVVAGGRVRLGAPFSKLRELAHRTPIDPTLIAWIQRTPLPQLEHLELAVGYHSEPFRTALDPARLPRLRQLSLTNSSYTEGLVVALAESRILPQLEVVDLSHGNLDDEAADRILAFHDSFRHLQRWRLGPQHVTYNAYLRLRDAGIDISLPKAYQNR